MMKNVVPVIIKSIIQRPSIYFSTQIHNYVPKHNPVQDKDVKLLETFIYSSEKLLVLTGAGISTESGEFLLFVSAILQVTFFSMLIIIIISIYFNRQA